MLHYPKNTAEVIAYVHMIIYACHIISFTRLNVHKEEGPIDLLSNLVARLYIKINVYLDQADEKR